MLTASAHPIPVEDHSNLVVTSGGILCPLGLDVVVCPRVALAADAEARHPDHVTSGRAEDDLHVTDVFDVRQPSLQVGSRVHQLKMRTGG